MKFIHLILTILLLCLWDGAGAGQYDWVTPKIPNNLTEINKASFVVGTIDKKKYLAIHLNTGNETQDEYNPALVFARIAADKTYHVFAVIKLEILLETSVKFKNKSIYLRHETAHHGVYSTIFQFKFKNNHFQLTGIESQSITLGNSTTTGKTIQLWEGVSANLLSSKASYWASALSMENEHEDERVITELKRYHQGLAPSKRIKKEVLLKRKHPVYLEHFNLYESDERSALCYSFDYDLRFYNYCK